MRQIAEKELGAREAKKRKRLEDKAKREAEAKAKLNSASPGTAASTESADHDNMMKIMGFGGFGSSKK